MKMLNLDVNDISKLSRMTREEAYEFLNEKEPIVCRISSRDFQEIDKAIELENLERLSEMGVYGKLEFYIR